MSGLRMENGASVFLRIAQLTQISQKGWISVRSSLENAYGFGNISLILRLPAFVIDVKESEYK